MSPTLLLIHGWGFGPVFWEALREALPDLSTVAADLGYFGPAREPAMDGPVVAVGHSTGALLALRSPPRNCISLVAINGFDHFAALDGAPGVPPRVLDRMAARLSTDPSGTVSDFRARCGDASPVGDPDGARLAQHLRLLRTADERARSSNWPLPLLHLSGCQDPILPAELRASSFSGARRLQRAEHPQGGHLLPATHPEWCAAQLRSWMAAL